MSPHGRRRPAGRRCLLAAALVLASAGTSSVVAISDAAGAASSAGAGGAFAGRKISVVTALLPPAANGSSARLRVEASGGCYRWRSDRPNLIVVEIPEALHPTAAALECLERKALECLDQGATVGHGLFPTSESRRSPATPPSEVSCQPVAVLRSLATNASATDKAVVVASDVGSPGVELRTEVYLAPIARIEIETSVRRINIDDVETLAVRAYDDKGNVFSSLEGLEFQWFVRDTRVLRTLPLAESVFKLSPARRALAKVGAQSDLLMLHGVETGHTRVSVRFGDLRSEEVELAVVEHPFIVPSIVLVPPLAHVQLRLKVLRGPWAPLDQLPEVTLPSPNFRWSADGDLAVSEDGGRVVALREGRGKVVVSDRRIDDNTAAADFEVVSPVALRAVAIQLDDSTVETDGHWEELHRRISDMESVAPGVPSDAMWQFVRGRSYLLRLDLLDRRGRPLRIPVNLRATFRCDGAAPLQVMRRTPNTAVLLVTAPTLGNGSLSYGDVLALADAEDEAQGLHTLKWPELRFEQRFEVVEAVRIAGPFEGPMVLPPWHSWRLEVSGGSGAYTFSLGGGAPGLCALSPDGVVQAQGQTGSVDVVVADARDPANNATIRVLVMHAGGLILRPLQLQLPLKPEGEDEVKVPVFARPEAVADDGRVAGARRLLFWNCSALSPELARASAAPSRAVAGDFSADSSSPSVATARVLRDAPKGGACAVISVDPHAPGDFALSVEVRRSSGAGAWLRAEIDLQVYAPLRLHYEGSAVDGELLLAPCSSITLRLAGGPAAPPGDRPGRVLRNFTAPLEGTHLRLTVSRDRKSFEVLCLQPTPAPARLTAELRIEPEDPEVGFGIVVARAAAFVRCAAPAALHIVHSSAAGAADSAAADAGPHGNRTVGIRRGRGNAFRARFLDEHGQQFLMASLFVARWSIHGGSERRSWLEDDGASAAIVTLPLEVRLGTVVSLRAEAALPRADECSEAYGLNDEQATHVRAGLEKVAPPLPDVLHLRATTDFSVRWPGYPARSLPFVPQFAFTLEGINGTGTARLEIVALDASSVDAAGGVELVEASTVCFGEPRKPGCMPALPASDTSAADGGERVQWFLRPLTPGRVRVVVEDARLVGGAREVVDLTFLPAGRISLELEDFEASGMTPATAAPLVVRGRSHRLTVHVFDVADQKLPASTWEALQLQVDANDSSLDVRRGVAPEDLAVFARSVGSGEVQARAYSDPTTLLYSNRLRVRVFEPFDIEPRSLALLPGQGFELSAIGGPRGSASGSARTEFVSSKPAVVEVHPRDGVLSATDVGTANITARLLEAGTDRELARVWAVVHVVLPDDVAISAPGPLLALDRGGRPVRLTATLSGRGVTLTPSALTGPTGVGGGLPAAAHTCRFSWTLSGHPSATLRAAQGGNATRQTSQVGAVAVEVAIAASAGEAPPSAGTSLDDEPALVVDLEVICPGTRQPLQARSLRLPTTPPLRLVGVAASSPCASAGGIRAPLGARLPLHFSRSREQLQMELVEAPGQTVPATVASLVDDSTSVGVVPCAGVAEIQAAELVAGDTEGEAVLVVRDRRAAAEPSRDGVAPARPALITPVLVRRPWALRIAGMPATLSILTTAECELTLEDATGMPLALPPNYDVSHVVSHPSVLASEVVRTPDGRALLRLVARQRGCAALDVSARAPGVPASAGVMLAAVGFLCVAEGGLVGRSRSPLLMSVGGWLHLSADLAVMHTFEPQANVFTLRLFRPEGGDLAALSPAQLAARLASEVTAVLQAEPGAIAAFGAPRWSPSAPAADDAGWGATTWGLEVDLRINWTLLLGGASLREVSESIWFPTVEVGPVLALLDRGFGFRARPLAPVAPGGDGCSTSDPVVLDILESSPSAPSAVARRRGTARLSLRRGAVLAEVEVLIALLSSARFGAPAGPQLLNASAPALARSPSALPGDPWAPMVTDIANGQLVVPLRLFAAAHGAGFGEEELFSGPFHVQDTRFTCASGEPVVALFFDILPWAMVANASTPELGPLSARRRPADPQAACVLRPRIVQVERLPDVPPPTDFELVAAAHGAPDFAPCDGARLPLRFAPQFVVVRAGGIRAVAGEVAAALSAGAPAAVLRVWTGGRPVEASLSAQLREARRGVLALVVESEPGSAWMTVRLEWQARRLWGGEEIVELLLESRVTKQAEAFKVKVDGRRPAASACSPGCCPCGPGDVAVVADDGSFAPLWAWWLLLLVVLVHIAFFWLYHCRQRRRAAAWSVQSGFQEPWGRDQPRAPFSGHRGAAVASQPPSAVLFGGGAAGLSPFQRVGGVS